MNSGFRPVHIGTPEQNREINMLLAEEDETESAWWWLSFADPARPAGSQFLGSCLVKAPNAPMAMQMAWNLGINPGGEVRAIGPLTEDQVPASQPRERLLSREEIDALDIPNG